MMLSLFVNKLYLQVKDFDFDLLLRHNLQILNIYEKFSTRVGRKFAHVWWGKSKFASFCFFLDKIMFYVPEKRWAFNLIDENDA